jgi:hypothetical protein
MSRVVIFRAACVFVLFDAGGDREPPVPSVTALAAAAAAAAAALTVAACLSLSIAATSAGHLPHRTCVFIYDE